jgi:hypothetical protein
MLRSLQNEVMAEGQEGSEQLGKRRQQEAVEEAPGGMRQHEVQGDGENEDEQLVMQQQSGQQGGNEGDAGVSPACSPQTSPIRHTVPASQQPECVVEPAVPGSTAQASKLPAGVKEQLELGIEYLAQWLLSCSHDLQTLRSGLQVLSMEAAAWPVLQQYSGQVAAAVQAHAQQLYGVRLAMLPLLK